MVQQACLICFRTIAPYDSTRRNLKEVAALSARQKERLGARDPAIHAACWNQGKSVTTEELVVRAIRMIPVNTVAVRVPVPRLAM